MPKKLEQALKIIEKSPTLIGQITHGIIKNRKVKIQYFSKMSKNDFESFCHSDTKLKKYVSQFSNQSINQVTSDVNGFCHGNRIFIKPKLTIDQMSSTIVHEIDHYRQSGCPEYPSDTEFEYNPNEEDDPQTVLESEMLAFLAERDFEGKYNTRYQRKKLRNLIIKIYQLDIYNH